MNKLSKDELLEYLDRAEKSFILGTFGKQDQAYQKIRRMIEERTNMLVVNVDPRAGGGKVLLNIEPTEEWIEEKAMQMSNIIQMFALESQGKLKGKSDISKVTDNFVRQLVKDLQPKKK